MQNLYKIAAAMTASCLISAVHAQDEYYTDPHMSIVESHYLDFPLLQKDFENWDTRGSSVHLKDKLVLVPETKLVKGMIYATQPNPIYKQWQMDFEVNIGNAKRANRGGVGLALLYLKQVDTEDNLSSLIGYTNKYEGAGIYINTNQQATKKTQKDQTMIHGEYNDGTRHVNLFKNTAAQDSNLDHCWMRMRNLEMKYTKVRVIYENQVLKVNVYDQNIQEFSKCFSMQVDLDYEGYFVFSASSGYIKPDHIYLKSIKLFDPSSVQSNNHFQDSHTRRGEFEAIATKMGLNMFDFIHDKSEETEMIQHTTLEQLYDQIEDKEYKLHQDFQKIASGLNSLQEHFQPVDEIFRKSEFYNNNDALKQTLPEEYSKMTQQLVIMDEKMYELQEELQKNDPMRRRMPNRSKRPGTIVNAEVNNQYTNNMQDNLDSLNGKLKPLKMSLEQLSKATREISDKSKKLASFIEMEDKILRQNTNQSIQDTQNIDLDEIDTIFAQIKSETSQSAFFSWVNLAMMIVIITSVALWIKLDNFEKGWK